MSIVLPVMSRGRVDRALVGIEVSLEGQLVLPSPFLSSLMSSKIGFAL